MNEETPTESSDPTLDTPKNIRDFADDARRYMHESMDTVREKTDQTIAAVREHSGEFVDSTIEGFERGKEVISDEYERAIHYIRKNPLTAVSIGVFAGVVLGAIFGGRGRR